MRNKMSEVLAGARVGGKWRFVVSNRGAQRVGLEGVGHQLHEGEVMGVGGKEGGVRAERSSTR